MGLCVPHAFLTKIRQLLCQTIYSMMFVQQAVSLKKEIVSPLGQKALLLPDQADCLPLRQRLGRFASSSLERSGVS